MIEVGKIKFKAPGRLHTFQSEGLKLHAGDFCIVKTDLGLKLGEVVVEPQKIELGPCCLQSVMKAVRRATTGDIKRHEELLKLEEEAFNICENKIEERELPMKLIGVEAVFDIVGGMGCCGRTLCCATFLREFTPVSIKMAKKQGLALNPTKISGQCGRLMCCIQYEYAIYAEAERKRDAGGEEKKATESDGNGAEGKAAESDKGGE